MWCCSMSNTRDRCSGPGSKQIYATKAEALAELQRIDPNRRARTGNGNAYRCPWGEHYHITSHKKPGR